MPHGNFDHCYKAPSVRRKIWPYVGSNRLIVLVTVVIYLINIFIWLILVVLTNDLHRDSLLNMMVEKIFTIRLYYMMFLVINFASFQSHYLYLLKVLPLNGRWVKIRFFDKCSTRELIITTNISLIHKWTVFYSLFFFIHNKRPAKNLISALHIVWKARHLLF